MPDQPQPQEIGALTGAIGPDRRTFVKGLVVGSVFAAPVVSSFTMSGVEAVFGSKAGATVLMSNANTAGPSYPLTVRCGVVTANGLAFTASAGGSRQVTLGVPIGALPLLTQVCVFVGTPSTFSGLFPGGDTPKSAFAVNWVGPNASAPIMLTVNDPAVGVGDKVFLVTKTTPQTVQSYSPSAVGSTLWAVLFTQDPNFVVVTPPVTPATPTAPSGAGAAAAVPAQPTFTG